MALVALSILATIHLQRSLDEHKDSVPFRISIIGMLAILVNDIWQHEKLWRVAHLPDMFNARDVNLSLVCVANHPDPLYAAAPIAGALVTVLSLGFLGWMAYWERKTATF